MTIKAPRMLTSLGIALGMCGVIPAWAAEGPSKQVELAQQAKPDAAFHYDSKGRRDPFIPLVRDGRVVSVTGDAQRAGGGAPVLYGILWDPAGKSIALLNDTEAKVGDTIEGYQVLEIRHDAVVLTNGGEPVVLQISFDVSPSKLSPRTTKGGGVR